MHLTHQYRAESAAVGAVMLLAKSLAETIRFWRDTGQIHADERVFAGGQLREFDAAWAKYDEVSKERERELSDRASRRKAS